MVFKYTLKLQKSEIVEMHNLKKNGGLSIIDESSVYVKIKMYK
jgi:hypothetical protein